MENLPTKLKTIPRTPGVYLFKDKRGEILYVGKAKLLASRVLSYFRANAILDPAKQQMVRKIVDLETISTDTENEALVLEANLIRRHQPPYNVVLRDDKYYLFIKITREETPRVFPVRKISKDGARYFGPYSSAASVRSTLRLLRRLFPHQADPASAKASAGKEKNQDYIFPHPLFTQSIKGTPKSFSKAGLTEEQYQQNVQNVMRFLKGDRKAIIETLRAGMKQAARDKHFERAATFRDQLQAIERLEGNQKVFLPRKESFDIISLATQGNRSAANLFAVRLGKLLDKKTFLLQHRPNTPVPDILRQFLLQYYREAQDIPQLILVPHALEDEAALANWIHKESPPTLLMPRRGVKRQLMSMGSLNAQQLLNQEEAVFQSDARLKKASQELFKAVGIEPASPALASPDESVRTGGGPPKWRVETYDISNIQGSLATASMVVFLEGKASPSQYRKFRMKIEGSPNDFAMMQEVLTRRFSHLRQGSGGQAGKANWPRPDLIVIDGGKGQLSAAQKVLNELQVSVPVISLAKREEEIFVPGRSTSIRLPYDSDALFLIQRMRDEAHRFTLTYHRLLRSKKQQRSILDEIPGIGPKTKRRLLNHFGSLKAIRAASQEELEKVVGKSTAATLQDYL